MVGDLRARAAAAGDQEGVEREDRKREGWMWENALRRHNFLGFTDVLLKAVVGEKVKTGVYDVWIEDGLKEETRRREEERGRKGGVGGVEEEED